MNIYRCKLFLTVMQGNIGDTGGRGWRGIGYAAFPCIVSVQKNCISTLFMQCDINFQISFDTLYLMIAFEYTQTNITIDSCNIFLVCLDHRMTWLTHSTLLKVAPSGLREKTL